MDDTIDGSGRSHGVLGAIAEGLVSQNWVRQGSHEQAVVILDTMNVFLTMPFLAAAVEPAKAIGEVERWGVGSDRIAVALYGPPNAPHPAGLTIHPFSLRASDMGTDEWCGMFEVDPFTDPIGHLINVVVEKVSSEGWVDKRDGTAVRPKAVYSIDALIRAIELDRDIDTYSRDTREALRRRLAAVARLGVFGDEGLDVRQWLRPGVVSVLLLRDWDQEVRNVIVAILTKRMMQLRAVSEQYERLIPIHRALAARLRTQDRSAAEREDVLALECAEAAAAGVPRSWLIIDEAHNYVPSRTMVPSRRPLKKYVDEGRNLGLSIVVATQQPAGLDPSLQRNADLLLIHALSHHDDIAAAMGMINTALPDEVIVENRRFAGHRSIEAIIRQLPIGVALASSDRASRLFPVKIRPRTTATGGSDY